MKSILRLQKYGGSYRKKRKVEIFNEVQSQLQQTNTHESYRGIKMRNEHKCHKQSLMAASRLYAEKVKAKTQRKGRTESILEELTTHNDSTMRAMQIL